MKKLTALALSILLVLTMVVVPTMADDAVKIGYFSSLVTEAKLDNVANINDYNAEAPAAEYKITDAAGLTKLSTLVNGGTNLLGVTVYLANDVDMKDVADFKPIGYSYGIAANVFEDPNPNSDADAVCAFAGTFDGQGHTIKNLTVSIANIANADLGLFGLVTSATIKNLIIDSTCSFTGNVSDNRVGAVVGRANSVTLTNVLNKAAVKGAFAGGMLGDARGTVAITNCTNEGTVDSANCAGGIVGFEGTNAIHTRNRNKGTVSITANAAALYVGVGGITGRQNAGAESSYIECVNNGEIVGKGNVGGLIGIVRYAAVKDCYNYGKITDNGTADNDSGELNGNLLSVYNSAVKTGLTNTNSEGRFGQTDASLAVPDVKDENDQDDLNKDPQGPVFENIATDPGKDNIGYSSARVEEVDLAGVIDMVNFDTAPMGTTRFKISTPAGLVALQKAVNEDFADFAGCTVYLTNDIDMSGVTNFVGMGGNNTLDNVNGGPQKTFAGTFDGLGNMIENLTISVIGAGVDFPTVGLFSCASGATIKNLILGENCVFEYKGLVNDAQTGALIGKSNGNCVIDNCWVRSTVVGRYWTGGIVGRTTSGSVTYINTTFSGKATAKGGSVGGFVGFTGGSYSMTNCRNTGTIKLDMAAVGTSVYNAAAGFAGRSNSGAADAYTFTNCVNNGTIIAPGNAAGIAGIVRIKITFNECVNYGLLATSEDLAKSGPLYAAYMTETSIADIVNEKTTADMYGKADNTFYLETNYTPDYTPVADVPANTEEDTTDIDDGTTAPEDITTDPEEEVSTPEATDEQETTKAPDTTEKTPDENKGGCSSSVLGGISLILIAAGAAIAMTKKKED